MSLHRMIVCHCHKQITGAQAGVEAERYSGQNQEQEQSRLRNTLYQYIFLNHLLLKIKINLIFLYEESNLKI